MEDQPIVYYSRSGSPSLWIYTKYSTFFYKYLPNGPKKVFNYFLFRYHFCGKLARDKRKNSVYSEDRAQKLRNRRKNSRYFSTDSEEPEILPFLLKIYRPVAPTNKVEKITVMINNMLSMLLGPTR
jgi:hypothetical protein